LVRGALVQAKYKVIQQKEIEGASPLQNLVPPSKEKNIKGEFKRGEVPLQKKHSPSPYQGEGDKGDRVDKKSL